jgi:hypothetical protein
MTLNEKLRFQMKEDLLKCFEATGVDPEDEKLGRRVDRFIYNTLIGIDEYFHDEGGSPAGRLIDSTDD